MIAGRELLLTAVESIHFEDLGHIISVDEGNALRPDLCNPDLGSSMFPIEGVMLDLNGCLETAGGSQT